MESSSERSGTMPVGFVAHGAPLLAIDERKGAGLLAWGRTIPKPRSILAISAHWEAAPVQLSATETVPLVYDFSGFPRELYALRYPAAGAPELAVRVKGLLGEAGMPVEVTRRGLDHGAWVPLLRMFPDADVPVLQMSMPTLEAAKLFALGRSLAPLRDEGVLVLGSGNVTHNLRQLDWEDSGGPPPAWARDFDSWVEDVLVRGDADMLLQYGTRAPGARTSLPTHEHFAPLLVAAGAASARGSSVSFPITGFEYGSLSRRSVQFG